MPFHSSRRESGQSLDRNSNLSSGEKTPIGESFFQRFVMKVRRNRASKSHSPTPSTALPYPQQRPGLLATLFGTATSCGGRSRRKSGEDGQQQKQHVPLIQQHLEETASKANQLEVAPTHFETCDEFLDIDADAEEVTGPILTPTEVTSAVPAGARRDHSPGPYVLKTEIRVLMGPAETYPKKDRNDDDAGASVQQQTQLASNFHHVTIQQPSTHVDIADISKQDAGSVESVKQELKEKVGEPVPTVVVVEEENVEFDSTLPKLDSQLLETEQDEITGNEMAPLEINPPEVKIRPELPELNLMEPTSQEIRNSESLRIALTPEREIAVLEQKTILESPKQSPNALAVPLAPLAVPTPSDDNSSGDDKKQTKKKTPASRSPTPKSAPGVARKPSPAKPPIAAQKKPSAAPVQQKRTPTPSPARPTAATAQKSSTAAAPAQQKRTPTPSPVRPTATAQKSPSKPTVQKPTAGSTAQTKSTVEKKPTTSSSAASAVPKKEVSRPKQPGSSKPTAPKKEPSTSKPKPTPAAGGTKGSQTARAPASTTATTARKPAPKSARPIR